MKILRRNEIFLFINQSYESIVYNFIDDTIWVEVLKDPHDVKLHILPEISVELNWKTIGPMGFIVIKREYDILNFILLEWGK